MELFFNDTVIDTFGDTSKDGTGEAWEYLDSWAYRVDGTTANTSFNLSDWTFGGVGALDTLDAAQQGAAVPFGTYSPSPVPEPATIASIMGLLGLAFVMVRRRR